MFGMQNGFLTTAYMTYAPELVADEKKAAAGFIMCLSLLIGIIFG